MKTQEPRFGPLRQAGVDQRERIATEPERQEAERETKRKELGVSDDLAKIAGVNTAMLVAFGENEIKTLTAKARRMIGQKSRGL